MENHNFLWVNPLSMAVFNSYVSLPEGNHPAIGDLPFLEPPWDFWRTWADRTSRSPPRSRPREGSRLPTFQRRPRLRTVPSSRWFQKGSVFSVFAYEIIHICGSCLGYVHLYMITNKKSMWIYIYNIYIYICISVYIYIIDYIYIYMYM